MDKVENGYAVEPHAHVQPATRHLEARLLRLDLGQELVDLRASEAFRARGHRAKTLAKYPELRLLLLAFKAGARLQERSTRGRLSMQVLDGRVALKLGRETTELSAGSLFTIAPSIGHDVTALEDCAILLTIAWPA